MKKSVVYTGILFISIVFCCKSEAEVRQESKKQQEMVLIDDLSVNYKLWEQEKEEYLVQCRQLREETEKAKKIYEKNGDNSSLIAYKECELAYQLSAFYEKEGEKWVRAQRNKDLAEVLSGISERKYCETELAYRKAQLRYLDLSKREAEKKLKKGRITELEYQEAVLLWKEERSHKEICENNIRELDEVLDQNKSKAVSEDFLGGSLIPHNAYFEYWSKNKIELLQYDNEINAYKVYKTGFDVRDVVQREKIQYAENKIELVRMRKERFLQGMKKLIIQKETKINNAEITLKMKEEAAEVAEKRVQMVKLLLEKGRAVESQAAEQEAIVKRLEYESAAQEYARDLCRIELEYNLNLNEVNE